MQSSAPDPHPVLDYSATLRARASALRLDSPDERWLGWRVEHRFVCAHGHGVLRTPRSVLDSPVACTVCVGLERMARLHATASEAGATCLDTAWSGFPGPYRFRCAQGHEWNHSASRVSCLRCLSSRRQTNLRSKDGLDRLIAKARDRGGECLSDVYLGTMHTHRFRCAKGHEWDTKAGIVLSGKWCRPCGREAMKVRMRDPDGLARLQQAAAAKGGVCLSPRYEGVIPRYRMRCAKGHEWDVPGAEVFQGAWCGVCERERRPGRTRDPEGLKRVQAAAAALGGECLSEVYLGQLKLHRFRCANGHEWETKPAGVLKKGDWCRPCGRQAMKENMRDPDGLARLQQAAAARGGVCLSSIYEGVMRRYRMRCAAGHEWEGKGSQLFSGVWCPTCDLESRRGRGLDPDGLKRLQTVAAAHGGVCLSESYLGSERRHRFRCAQGHEWEAVAGGVANRGQWCRRCAYDAMRLGMEAAHEMAHARGGKCLSEVELVSQARLTWECHRGHVWQTQFQIVRNGHWCPECARMARITNKHSKARRRYEVEG